MANFTRDHFPFHCQGLNLSLPVDKLPKDKYRVLDNVRPSGDGQIHGRQGIIKYSVGDAPVEADAHSIKRMDDPIPSPKEFEGAFEPYNRLMGVSTSLLSAGSDSDPVSFSVADTGYSGDPLSFAIASGDLSPRSACYVADSNQLKKFLSSQQVFAWGVAPPNFAPNAELYGGGSDGPDVGATGRPYIYRFVARSWSGINTAALSNPGPPMRNAEGLEPTGDFILVTVPEAHPDPQVRWLDIYRFGGTLPEWLYAGIIANAGGHEFIDDQADADIASNRRLDFDNAQPFVTIDTPKKGTCSVTALPDEGATITLDDGADKDLFREHETSTDLIYDATGVNPYYVLGNEIIIAGKPFTFYAAPEVNNVAVLVEDASELDGSSGLEWIMPAPEMYRKPLQRVWGPWGGGATGIFIFGVGNALRPGALYWTKGNSPESHSGVFVLDITSASEPLMNGVLYEGRSFVFSNERLFQVLPSFGQVSNFTAIEVPNAKGLFARWAIAVGPKMWWLARDGIYETTGGAPRSITDEDLYPLFQHEGITAQATWVPDGLDGVTIDPPDFTRLADLRLAYADGYLYFDYVDTGVVRRTLVYDTNPAGLAHRGGWVSRDNYNPAIVCHYNEEGEGRHEVLMGTGIGQLARYGEHGDMGSTVASHVRTGARDHGDARPRAHYGDAELDYDSDCEELTVKLGFDGYKFWSATETTGLNLHGRRRSIIDIEDGKGQYAANVGIDIVWNGAAGTPKLYYWEPSYIVKPEVTRQRVTDWTDLGYKGAKFLQGFRLTADTLAVARVINVEAEDGSAQNFIGPTGTVNEVNHDGERIEAYSFVTPFITHQVRLWPTGEKFWREFGEVEWVWEPAPELVRHWITQETTHDLKGFFHHRDSYIPLISTAAVVYTITVDGTDYTYSVPSTAGAYLKQYLVLQPMKGKYAKYSLTCASAGFRLFQRDCEVRVKAWGQGGPYLVKMPFGDVSRIKGAAI